MKTSVLRFNSEKLARFTADTILGIGRVEEKPLQASHPVEEFEAEIIATVLVGRLLVFGILVLSIQVLLAVVSSSLLNFIPGVAFAVFIFSLNFLWVGVFVRVLNRQVQAGFVTGWFHPRAVKAWLSVDENYLRVRTWRRAGGYSPFGYLPIEVRWKDPLNFSVKMERLEFQFLFRTSGDAARIMEKMRTAFPQMQVFLTAS